MVKHFRTIISQQTALLTLCGLLPFVCLAQQRSTSDAISIANEFTKSRVEENFTDLKLLLSSSSATLSEKIKKGKEAYYIFSSLSNNPGFVIVSGDERMPAILAYSDENDFDINNIPPNVRYWLDCYAETFLSLDSINSVNGRQTLTTNYNGVAPLIENNKWGQSDPYNRLCPTVGREKCVTGCVATAMAQVMKYHNYPSVGKGEVNYTTQTNNIHVLHDFNSIQFKWDNMLDDYSGKFTSTESEAVAELMYSCGASVQMDYCTSAQGGSAAYQKDLVTAFVDNFYYDQDAAFMARNYCSVEDWHNLLIKELEEGRLVNYGGQSARDGGHSFVLDGYRFSEGNKYPDYHVNWGWKGNCNGYYQIADLHPVEDGQHATMSGFNSSQQMTIGIKPEDGIDDGMYYLCTPNLYVSSSMIKAGSTIQVYTASCENYSYKDFGGTLHVALIPSDGSEEIILGEEKIRNLVYMQRINNVSIEITLPANLAEGQYTIQLRSKHSKQDKLCQVFSKKYPEISISNNGSQNPVTTNKAMLGSSELEIEKTPDSSFISLNIYELQNLLESPFIGDLRMILADKQGKQLCAFGDSIQPGELSMNEIVEDPLKITGQLNGNWPNGDYKIYVGARLINTSDYVYVSYYDIVQPDMNSQELYLNAKIKDGSLIIGNMTFTTLSTSIKKEVYTHDNTIMIGFDGKQNPEPAKNGIYIIKASDGSFRKVVSRGR